MRRKTLTIASAITLTILLIVSLALTFYFAQLVSLDAIISCIIGVVLSFAFAPIFHELGHIVVADLMKMQIVYAKFFCVKLLRKKDKLRMRFVSPFRPDETQAVPKTSGNIYKRARVYTLGGLIFAGGFYSISLVALAILAWLIWELCVMLYPERFWEMTNLSLKCCECTDKLCTQYCQKLRK